MKILAFDTSATIASVALCEDTKLLADLIVRTTLQH